MNVKELKEAIKDLPDDMDMMLQIDSEGNGYKKVKGIDPNAVYCEEEGDVYSLEWSADEVCKDEDEWENIKSRPKCLVVYPE